MLRAKLQVCTYCDVYYIALHCVFLLEQEFDRGFWTTESSDSALAVSTNSQNNPTNSDDILSESTNRDSRSRTAANPDTDLVYSTGSDNTLVDATNSDNILADSTNPDNALSHLTTNNNLDVSATNSDSSVSFTYTYYVNVSTEATGSQTEVIPPDNTF